MEKFLKNIKDSIFRHSWPKSDKDKLFAMISNIFFHIHSPRVRIRTLKITTTFGLGTILAILFIILTVTGILLMFYYIPHPSVAYRSMKDIQFTVPNGQLLRNVHRWAAHAMVILVFLHMMRIFYTGSYKPPREFNWVIGVCLLLLTLALSYTGYLLPWDQLAYWAITVGTNIVRYFPIVGEKLKYLLLGGTTIGEGTLIRFYVLHIAVLPVFMLILIAVHIWRIRKDGGLAHPDENILFNKGENEVLKGDTSKTYGLMTVVDGKIFARTIKEPEDSITSWPHLLYRELILFIIVMDVLLLVSFLFDAPLEELADPTITPNPAKAPWYFLGLQELVHYSAFVGGVLVPVLFIGGLILTPYIDRKIEGVGIYWHPSRLWKNILFTVVLTILLLLTIIGTYFRGENWSFTLPWK